MTTDENPRSIPLQVAAYDAIDQVASSSSERGYLPSYRTTVCKRRSATWPGCQPLPQLIRPWSCRSTSFLNRFPCSADWKNRPGRPHGLWVDQLRQDNHSPADLCRFAIRRGHSGATLRSSL